MRVYQYPNNAAFLMRSAAALPNNDAHRHTNKTLIRTYGENANNNCDAQLLLFTNGIKYAIVLYEFCIMYLVYSKYLCSVSK